MNKIIENDFFYNLNKKYYKKHKNLMHIYCSSIFERVK